MAKRLTKKERERRAKISKALKAYHTAKRAAKRKPRPKRKKTVKRKPRVPKKERERRAKISAALKAHHAAKRKPKPKPKPTIKRKPRATQKERERRAKISISLTAYHARKKEPRLRPKDKVKAPVRPGVPPEKPPPVPPGLPDGFEELANPGQVLALIRGVLEQMASKLANDGYATFVDSELNLDATIDAELRVPVTELDLVTALQDIAAALSDHLRLKLGRYRVWIGMLVVVAPDTLLDESPLPSYRGANFVETYYSPANRIAKILFDANTNVIEPMEAVGFEITEIRLRFYWQQSGRRPPGGRVYTE